MVVRTGGWLAAVVEVKGEPIVLLVSVEVSGEAAACVRGEGEGGGGVDSKEVREGIGFRSRGW